MYGVRKWERGPGEGREQCGAGGGLIMLGLKGFTKDFHLYSKRGDWKVLIWETMQPYLIANRIRMSSKETSININAYIHNVANISNIYVENKRWLPVSCIQPGLVIRPGGSGWRGRWEGGSGWGRHQGRFISMYDKIHYKLKKKKRKEKSAPIFSYVKYRKLHISCRKVIIQVVICEFHIF